MNNLEQNNHQTHICSRCKKDKNAISPQRRCSCKGAGSGKESDTDRMDDALKALHAYLPAEAVTPASSPLSVAPSLRSTWFAPTPSPSKKFDMEVILSLLQKGRITIDDCKQDSVLVITCPDLNLLSKHERNELKKFIQAIQNDAETLLKEMSFEPKHYLNRIEKDNVLSFTVNLSSNPSLYAKFIERLTNHLLFASLQNAIDKQKQPFHPSPFSTTLRPKNIL